MAFSKARRLSDFIAADGTVPATKFATGTITSAMIADTSITPTDLHTSLDLTGKTVTVATASGTTNTTAAASTAFVQQELTTLIGGAPSTLNDLNELAAAINDDANYNSTLTTALATKLPLAGGTLTGALIGTSATFSPSSGKTFVIASDSGDGPYIGTSGNQSLRIITNNTTRITVAAAGNVGIGTTPETYHSDYKAIDINNSASVMGYSGNNGAWLMENLYYGTDGNWKHKNSDFSAAIEMYDGVFNFYNTASGTADATATLQNRLKIDASGNVGIGQVPGTNNKFVVKGSVVGTAANLAETAQLAILSLNYPRGNVNSGIHFGYATANYIQAADDSGANAKNLTLNPFGGNVGIGTASPNSKLMVIDTGDARKQIEFSNHATYRGSIGHDAGSGRNEYRTEAGGGMHAFFKGATSTTPEMIIDNNGDVLIGSATNLNVLSGTPKLQIGSGTGHASLQFYSGASSVNGIYFGDDSNANVNRYDGYIEYQHANRLISFRVSGVNPMTLKGTGPLLPAGDFAYHTTQEHYTNPSSPGSYSTATNTAYTSSTQYWPVEGEKMVCVINARAFTKYLHIKTNLTANNIMFYFRTKGYYYNYGCEEQLVGGYTYNNGSNIVINLNNEAVVGTTHSGTTYRASDGSLVLKMDINQTGYTEGKMIVFFHAHAPSTVSGITVTAVTQKDDGTNAF